MKKAIFFIMCIFIVFNTYSQNDLIEVVYLKNGSVIRGVVIEDISNQTIRIHTKDGNIFVYNLNEVQEITEDTVVLTSSPKLTVKSTGATVINNIPNIAMPKPVNHQAEFKKHIDEAVMLAKYMTAAYGNVGKQPSISDIENNPNLSQREKSDIITNYHKQILNSIQPQNMISPGETSYEEMEPYIKSKDFSKLGYNPQSNNEQRYKDYRESKAQDISNTIIIITSIAIGSVLLILFFNWIKKNT